MLSKDTGKKFLKFVKYMFPAVFDLSVYSLCQIFNGMMTSRWINATAMGAVSVASPFISVIYAYALIFGVGGGTVISIYRGRGDEQTAKEIFTMNMTFMIATTVAIGLAAFVFTKQLAVLLGATPENMEYVVQYLKIVTATSLPYGLCYTLSPMLKADGHPLLGLIGSTVGSATSLIMLYVLLAGFSAGIGAVAVASATAQWIISILYLSHFFTKRATLRFVRFQMDWREIWRIIRIGFPDAISEASSGIFVLIFNLIVFRLLGEVGIIAFSVVNYMNLTAVQLSLGVTQGMQPLVSYHYGREEYGTCKLYLNFARFTVLCICFAMFAVCRFATGTVVSIFLESTDEAAFAAAVHALKTFSWFFPLVGLPVVSIGFFSAIEKQGWSQVLSLFRGLFGIGALGVLMTALFGETGTWLAPAVTEAITLAIAVCFFAALKRRGWRKDALRQ